jgi:FkbM family methyltransferase
MTNPIPGASEASLMRLAILPYIGFKPYGILDIGAHEGSWARSIRGIFPSTYILMIDALEEKSTDLATTCQELGNADYKIALLGEHSFVQKVFHVVNASAGTYICKTGSSVYPENSLYPKEPRIIQQQALGDVLKDDKHTYHFMKIDVQGAELDILDGMGARLNDIEFIQMECSALDYNQGAPLFSTVIEHMHQLGFVLFDIIEMLYQDVFLAQFDALFVRKTSDFRPNLGQIARGAQYKPR